jgi:hypothetical protein
VAFIPTQISFDRTAAIRLFLLGFLTLFLELVLIRYLAGNIWNLGYFPNLVLMGAFVGMGIGFAFHHRFAKATSDRLFAAAAVSLAALILFVHVSRPVLPGMASHASGPEGELFFSSVPEGTGRGTGVGALVTWFAGVVVVFALVAQRTAKLFARFTPLTAYTLDIAGSCCGILAFMLASSLWLPAAAWFLILLPLVVGAMERPAPWGVTMVVLVLLATAGLVRCQDSRLLGQRAVSGPFQAIWSPYQKVECVATGPQTHSIYANGIIHQQVYSREWLARSFYTWPYEQRRGRRDVAPYRHVLVIGAGAGNDVAAALATGAESVDAVEIDPVLVDLGRRLHPCRPYDDPRVQVAVDDGRSFVRRSTKTYDLIVFALTDSLVKLSALSQLRLENYLFTIESISWAWRRNACAARLAKLR